MEKQEKLREWCVEQAVNLDRAGVKSIKTIIEDAKKLEEYVGEDRVWKAKTYYHFDDNITNPNIDTG